MQETQLKDLILKLKQLRCEFQTVEVKSARDGCPTHLYDTLSSFSNQSSGGVVVFGIDEKADFAVVGVYDAQDLQHRVSEQCKEMSPEVRPLFSVAEIGETVDGGVRFLANEKFTGRIDEMLSGAVDFVIRNMRVKTVIGKDGRRDDRAEFPVTAVREAILNARVHRDYSLQRFTSAR